MPNRITRGYGLFGKVYASVINFGGTLLAATGAELNRVADVSARLVSATAATLAVTEALHESKTIVANRAGGIAFTLPAATGGGARYRIAVGTTFTTAGTVAVTGNDTFFGTVFGAQDGGASVEGWEAAAGNNRLTLDGTTTGGLKGDIVEFEDIAADVWRVLGFVQQTGAQATPFSTV